MFPFQSSFDPEINSIFFQKMFKNILAWESSNINSIISGWWPWSATYYSLLYFVIWKKNTDFLINSFKSWSLISQINPLLYTIFSGCVNRFSMPWQNKSHYTWTVNASSQPVLNVIQLKTIYHNKIKKWYFYWFDLFYPFVHAKYQIRPV